MAITKCICMYIFLMFLATQGKDIMNVFTCRYTTQHPKIYIMHSRMFIDKYASIFYTYIDIVVYSRPSVCNPVRTIIEKQYYPLYIPIYNENVYKYRKSQKHFNSITAF